MQERKANPVIIWEGWVIMREMGRGNQMKRANGNHSILQLKISCPVRPDYKSQVFETLSDERRKKLSF